MVVARPSLPSTHHRGLPRCGTIHPVQCRLGLSGGRSPSSYELGVHKELAGEAHLRVGSGVVSQLIGYPR